MVSIPRLVDALGGDKFLKSIRLDIDRFDEIELIKRVRSGLPYSALESLAKRFGLSPTELLRVLRIPQRTLARRKKSQMLAMDESDRLVRLARIGVLAEQTHGNEVRAGRWLREPNSALGNTAPILWLDTDLGTTEVAELLIRITHGVYS